MVLKGKAKKDYQRHYMRGYRLKRRVVRPLEMTDIRPPPEAKNQHPYGYPGMVGVDIDGNPIYEDV